MPAPDSGTLRRHLAVLLAADGDSQMTHHTTPAQAEGLYDPRFEHDACGVAMVARLDDEQTHEVVRRALEALDNLEHRGAEGADVRTGDGAGILVQLPDAFLRGVAGVELPPPGQYGVGMCFLPHDRAVRAKLEDMIERNVRVEGQRVLGWRDVPVDEAHVGSTANASRPYVKQLFVGAGGDHDPARPDDFDQDAFERKLYVIRRIVELAAGPSFYAASFSSRTLVYKGMLISHQLRGFYPDLQDERFASALALVHSRFSTNTFPSWDLAHPFRVIAHNGEINTLMGNVNWMRARESQLASELFGRDLPKTLPVVRPGGSDSATFDNVLELLMLAGRSLPHAAMMMIPEAYAGRDDLSDELKGFYAYHSCLMEPWDGPAAVAFTNGRVVGATLDRNGLRPGRWVETKDGHVILGSETGMLDVAPAEVLRKGRLAPGKLFLVDLDRGRIVEDGEVKREVATHRPYAEWHRANVVHFNDLEPRAGARRHTEPPLHERQLAFGFTQEDLRVLLAPMAARGEEPIGSMGNDAALAVLSDRRPLALQLLQAALRAGHEPADRPDPRAARDVAGHGRGPRAQPARRDARARPPARDGPAHPAQRRARDAARRVERRSSGRTRSTSPGRSADGVEGLHRRIAEVCDEATDAIAAGVNILILSDRAVGRGRVAIPSLLAVASVHHHLVRTGERLRAGLVLESGEPREVHHFATLIGYGASAVNPYVLLDSVDALAAEGRVPGDRRRRRPPSATSSRRSARACSRRSPRWGSRRSSPTAGRRSSRRSAWSARWSSATSPARRRASAASASRCWPPRRSSATPSAAGRPARPRTCCPSAASTPGAATASTTCGTRTRSRCCSTPCGPRERATRSQKYDEYSRLVNEDAARRATLRGLLGFRDRPRAGRRSTRSSRRRRSSSASPPGRCRSARSPPRPTRRWRSR